MQLWNKLFAGRKAIIGMIHVPALPGTPLGSLKINDIIGKALAEADIYARHGLDALLLENMHDLPYMKQNVGPEITAVLTSVACALKREFPLPMGIQILAACNREALAVALAADLQFIRAEGFVFGQVADEGYIDSCAGPLLRYRRSIGAEHIAILTDIKKKHSAHVITSDISLGETAATAEFFLSDGLVITGSATGKAVNPSDLNEARNQAGLPLIIGSGITAENLPDYWSLADGFIVGSYLKEKGLWSNPLSEQRISRLLEAAGTLRFANKPDEPEVS